MNKSDSISKLAQALCEAQKTELFALTDKENPFFKSRYADLSSVWSAIRKPLTDNGLSVVQTMDISDGGVIIETTLLHISGEYISGKLKMTPEKQTPQGVGAAITYGRRYALSAIIGIAPEDDDVEGAMDRKKTKTSTKTKKKELEQSQWNQIKAIGIKKELSEAEVIKLVQFVAKREKIAPRDYEIAGLFLPEAMFQARLNEFLDAIETNAGSKGD